MTAWRAFYIGIGRKTVLGFGDTYRKVPKTLLLKLRKLAFDTALRVDAARPVQALRNGLHLVPEGHVVRIQQPKLGGSAIGELDDGMSEIGRTLTTAGPVIGNDRFDAEFAAKFLQSAELGISIGAEAVDRNNGWHPELAQIADMPREVGKPALECADILLA